MSVLDHLIAAPGVYWGEGHGPGGGHFVARVALVVEDEHSLTFDYEAWSAEGGLHHAESARMARSGPTVVLAATSNGGDDTMLFREGDPGVFGSLGPQRVGLVIGAGDQELTFSWWWTGRDGVLREQSSATLAPMRQVVPAPAIPTTDAEDDAPDAAEEDAPDAAEDDALPDAEERPDASASRNEPGPPEADEPRDDQLEQATDERRHEREHPGDDEPDQPDDEPADELVDEPPDEIDDEVQPSAVGGPGTTSTTPSTEASTAPPTVPWPGILVLNGPSTGIVAQRLAARLTRAAVVRTDLFDRAVRGTAGRPDPALRQRIALSVVQGYAATGHPVILHGASTRDEHEALAAAISRTGLSPVKLVDVAEGEDYGEVARRLIESD